MAWQAVRICAYPLCCESLEGKRPQALYCERAHKEAHLQMRKREVAPKERPQNKRAYINELKSNPCTDCGKTYPPAVMEFDHLPGEEKLFNISKYASYSFEKLKKELEKCELVCANCHRVRTGSRLELDTPLFNENVM